MTLPLQGRIFRLPHTAALLVGLVIGYIGLIVWQGLRPIVLLSGAVIVGVTVVCWHRLLFQPQRTATSDNLLQANLFLSRLRVLEQSIAESAQPQWQTIQQQAIAIQQIASQIAQQEATLIPDLLETLHTVLGLAEQVSAAQQTTQQVKTKRYRELAQQRLRHSQMRLQETHDQLQELRDQIAIDRLGESSLMMPSGLSQRLQILIAENEKEILGD